MPQGGAINVIPEAVAARLARLMALAGTRELARLGVNVIWNADRPDIVQRAREATDEMFGAIVETAGTRVKDYFASQLQEGKAPADIAKSLADQFDGVPGRQARMVARTVTRQLYNEATLDAYESAGVRHVIASDGHGGLTGKTDPGCVARNGRTYTIAEARLQEHSPTTHPNCTLSWQPVVPNEGLQSIPDTVLEQPPPNGQRHLYLAWDPDRHPRWPKGTPKAGEFMHTHDLLEHLIADTHDRPLDVSFLARGAQRIERVTASLADDDQLDLRVHLRDGTNHSIGATRGTPIQNIIRALGAIDAASPTSAAAEPRDADAVLAAAGAPIHLADTADNNRLRGVLARPSQTVAATHDERRDSYDLTIAPSTPGWAEHRGVLGGEPYPRRDTRYDPALMEEVPDPHDPAVSIVRLRRDTDYAPYIDPQYARDVEKGYPAVMEARPGYIYRGVTADEYDAIQRTGEIRSNGSYNLGDAQSGLTSFGEEPATGASYASSFAPPQFQPTPGRPNYVLEVRRPDNAIDGNVLPGSGHRGVPGEVGVPGAVPASEIARVAEVRVVEARPIEVSIRREHDGSWHEGSANYSSSRYAFRLIGGPDRETAQRTEEKDLRDIGPGDRFTIVSGTPRLRGVIFERLTQGDSQRGDGRITVRNTEDGKRVHMAPDRRIDHLLKNEQPATAKVSELAKGDRFFVGDREYERITEGPSRRGDGRITGRELATGKRVHFKPDREVQRRAGEVKPPEPKKPPVKRPPVRRPVEKPPKGHVPLNTLKEGDEFMRPSTRTSDGEDTLPAKRYRLTEIRHNGSVFIAAPVDAGGNIPPDGHDRVDFSGGDLLVLPVEPIEVDDRTKTPELPPEYERLPREGEAMVSLQERYQRPPDGYFYVRVPRAVWESGDKTMKPPPAGRSGMGYFTGRFYGGYEPYSPSEDSVTVLVERQAHRKTPYMRDADVSFASISRKNVVAVWNDHGEQTFYRSPTVPAEKKPGKLVVGRRYPVAQIPDGATVRYDGKQWQKQTGPHGPSLHRTDEKGTPENALLADGDLVTYGVVEQTFPRERIRSTEKVPARQLDQGELVELDGLVYYRTGITRKGDYVGVHLQLQGDTSAPIVRVPLEQELDAIQLSPPKGRMFAARNLEPGDTFRDAYGAWRVTRRERGRSGALRIRVVPADAPDGGDRTLNGRDSVLPGLTEPAANGRMFLWEVPAGEHFTIHEGRGREMGYRMLRDAGARAGQFEVEDLQTGRDHMLYARGVPNATLGLPEGVTPLPPRVEVPGMRLRDLTGDKFSIGAVRYQRSGFGGPRGTISAYNLVGSDDERDQLHHLSGSTLVVPDGEDDPYGTGVERRRRLVEKARELYESRRVPVTAEEFSDVGAVVHAAIMAPLEDPRRRAQLEALPSEARHQALQDEFREVLGAIRGFGGERPVVHDHEGMELDSKGNSFQMRPIAPAWRQKMLGVGRWLPDGWVGEINDQPGQTSVGYGTGRAFYRHFGLLGQSRLIALSDSDESTMLHEFVHRVEHGLPDLQRLASEFWNRRTAGDPDVSIYGTDDEVTKEDHFHLRYAGKRYGHRGGGEILSMGFQDLAYPGRRSADNQRMRLSGRFDIYRDDPDYAHFLLGLLAAYKSERETEQRVSGT